MKAGTFGPSKEGADAKHIAAAGPATRSGTAEDKANKEIFAGVGREGAPQFVYSSDVCIQKIWRLLYDEHMECYYIEKSTI